MGFERQQFTFYRSFLNIIEQLPDRKQREFMLVLIRYALNETEPSTRDSTIRAAFEGLRPILDKARNKAKSGKNGGEASGENRKQNRSKLEANRIKSEAEGEKEKEEEKEKEVQYEGEEEGNAAPDGEKQEAFSEVFERLEQASSIFDKDREDVESVCREYGARAVIEAIDEAVRKGAPRWPYVRAIVTSGGVRQRRRNGYQRHDEPPSPGMLAAIQDMLNEPDYEEGTT